MCCLFIKAILHNPKNKSYEHIWQAGTNAGTISTKSAFKPLNRKTLLETILKTDVWSGESTFRKFYNKPIHKIGEFGLSVVDNVKN